MGWWSIGGFPEELMGDRPADHAADALSKLVEVRKAAGKEPPRYEEILPPLCAALAHSRTRLRLPPHKSVEAVALVLDEARVELRLADAVAPPEEVACFTELMRDVRGAYQSSLDRAPSPRELLEAVSFVARPVPSDLLHPEEARGLKNFQAIVRDDRGALPEEEVIAAVGAALRRRAGKLGALLMNGESLEVAGLVVMPHEGQARGVEFKGLRADPFVVDEVSKLLDTLAKHHKEESRTQRLPHAVELMGELLRALGAQQERYRVGGIKEIELRMTGAAGETPAAPRVRHRKFGEGTVVREIAGTEKKLEIFFDDGGTRTLLAKFVEPIEG